jgi:membrane fusion protein (multidrug efflux system)
VVGDRAARTPVVLGQRRPGFVEVREGLARDAMVVTAGQQQLSDGARLQVSTPAPAAVPNSGG